MMKEISVDKVRAQIPKLQREREALLNQVRSRNEVGAEINRQAQRSADVADAHIDRSLQQLACGDTLNPLTIRTFGHVREDGTVDVSIDLAPWLVAAVGADKVAAMFLDRLGVVPVSLDAPAREARLAAIAEELDQLELAEERLVEASNGAIKRRPDARVEIVLSI